MIEPLNELIDGIAQLIYLSTGLDPRWIKNIMFKNRMEIIKWIQKNKENLQKLLNQL